MIVIKIIRIQRHLKYEMSTNPISTWTLQATPTNDGEMVQVANHKTLTMIKFNTNYCVRQETVKYTVFIQMQGTIECNAHPAKELAKKLAGIMCSLMKHSCK